MHHKNTPGKSGKFRLLFNKKLGFKIGWVMKKNKKIVRIVKIIKK
jgi:hypothetical protein